MNKVQKDKFIKILLRTAAAVCVVLGLSYAPLPVQAQQPGSITSCNAPMNLSNSEGYSSNDPFLIADPAGVAHLFWAERVFGSPGSGGTDAVMYSKWDGISWSEPNDIFLTPPDHVNRQIFGVRGVLDEEGIIHLAWMGPDNTFYYSSARADQAGIAAEWEKPFLLADDEAGTQFSFDIAYEPPSTLHILYGASRENDAPSVSYIRSTDNGLTWTDPKDIFLFSGLDRGASNIRLLVDDRPGRIYATWTEWDLSGNGQAIYFAKTIDDGDTWSVPVLLDKRAKNDYERDWTNLAKLGRDQLVVIWEGGFRAYPQAQYSYDDGETWTKPIDTFPWLIADNGYAHLLYDNTGRLHTFLVRRIREGAGDVCRFPGCAQAEARGSTNTLWHSVWEGGTIWRTPEPVGNFGDGKLGDIGGAYSTVAFVEGNRLVAAWFSYLVQEIIVMDCKVEGAIHEPARPWPTATPNPTPTATATPVLPDVTPGLPHRSQQIQNLPPVTSQENPNPGFAILVGTLLSLIPLAGFVYIRLRHR